MSLHKASTLHPFSSPTLPAAVVHKICCHLVSRASVGVWFDEYGMRCGGAVRAREFECQRRHPPTTVAAGMAPACTNIRWHHGCVERKERQSLLNQKGCVVWITGLSGSGKSTVACAVDHALARIGKLCYVLDGDNVRHGLCKDLGFSVEDREENIRRVGEVAKLMADAGVVTLVSCISPYRRDREFVRGLMSTGEFVEVYMKVPLSICEKRDCKGLHKLARAGASQGFTGIDDPYEVSEKPEVTSEATSAAREIVPRDRMAEIVIDHLVVNGLLTGPCF